jgi:hypothetical protein
MTADETNGENADLLELVMEGMKWDKKKAQLWFNIPNPLLGEVTPNAYEMMRGKEKLLKFIKNRLSENKPND